MIMVNRKSFLTKTTWFCSAANPATIAHRLEVFFTNLESISATIFSKLRWILLVALSDIFTITLLAPAIKAVPVSFLSMKFANTFRSPATRTNLLTDIFKHTLRILLNVEIV